MFVCLKIIFRNELNLIKATCSIISLSMILRTIKLKCLSLARLSVTNKAGSYPSVAPFK